GARARRCGGRGRGRELARRSGRGGRATAHDAALRRRLRIPGRRPLVVLALTTATDRAGAPTMIRKFAAPFLALAALPLGAADGALDTTFHPPDGYVVTWSSLVGAAA